MSDTQAHRTQLRVSSPPHDDQDEEPASMMVSPGSELDQCGDEMLDTVDSVVGCVNQNHAELQHQYEERFPEQQLDETTQQVAIICSSSSAQSCGAAEQVVDMMLPATTPTNKPPCSLYKCQECSSTQVLRQLQPDVQETIWWPCDQCQKDSRWNPVVDDGAAENDGCILQ